MPGDFLLKQDWVNISKQFNLCKIGMQSAKWTAKWSSKTKLFWSNLRPIMRSADKFCDRILDHKISSQNFPWWNVTDVRPTKWLCDCILDHRMVFKMELLLVQSAKVLRLAKLICDRIMDCRNFMFIKFFPLTPQCIALPNKSVPCQACKPQKISTTFLTY